MPNPYRYRIGIERAAAFRYRRSMSLVQLESFVTVAQTEHVGRAAKLLHMSQPPLTRRIKSLEDELGVQLFERLPRGMRLLPAGERLLQHAREILGAVARARDEITGDRTPASSSGRRSHPDSSPRRSR
jgi:DNA-binding transcriptional LysR family regulator